MDKSPQKEMFEFFGACIGMGGVLLIIVGSIILKFLEAFGVIKIVV